MPSTSIRLRPGVDTVKTPAVNEAGISSSNMIRFREGMVEKRGGWTKFIGQGVSSLARALLAWRDFHGNTNLAVGSVNNLSVITGGTVADLTPTSGVTNGVTFTTTSGSNVVTVMDPNWSPTANDLVVFNFPISANGAVLHSIQNPTPVNGTQYTITASNQATSSGSTSGTLTRLSTTANSNVITATLPNHGLQVGQSFYTNDVLMVGGVTIAGTYTIASVIDANTFKFSVSTAARTADGVTDNGGVSTVYRYFVPLVGQAKRGTPISVSDWTLANYGQVLIACGAGAIYYWQSDGTYAALRLLPNAPIVVRGILVADAQQMIVAYGTSGAYGDGNLVQWCDAGDYSVWTAAGTNQAGSFRLPTGSGIVGAATASQVILLWTDADVWSMAYIGYPFVWSFNKISTGCGLIGQQAFVRLGPLTFWMGQKGFWLFDGASVQAIGCPLWDSIFPVLSVANAYKIRGGSNAAFHEVMWFFPSTAGNGENDTYVCYNVLEQVWDVGTIARSAWTDLSVAGLPLGADAAGNVYQHETSPDAAGAPIQASFTTGWFLIEEGETFSFVDMIRPDIKFPAGVGTVQVSVLTCAFTTDAPTIAGPYPITAATEYINTRCRGRYVALRFASSDLGSFWRMGRVQMRYAPSGRR